MSLLSFLFGSSYKQRAKRDQSRLGTRFKNAISPFNSYGTCFSCSGSGRKTFDCRGCGGSGTYTGTCKSCEGTGTRTLPAKPCLTCEGSGKVRGSMCRRCSGTGTFRDELTVTCKRCSGTGSFSATCQKCGGSGDRDVTCKKCSGSGWHRF